jgi:hypothetical protein
MEEDDLKRLVSEGEIRAFRDAENMKFRKSDIEGLKKGRMTEPTIILPGDSEESSNESEVLLVEEDTSETLLNIDDLDNTSHSSSVKLMEDDLEDVSSSSSSSMTDELTFEPEKENDSESFVFEDNKKDNFIESDTGLQTEPLDNVMMDLESEKSKKSKKSSQKSTSTKTSNKKPIVKQEEEENLTQPLEEFGASTHMSPIIQEEPVSMGILAVLVCSTIVLLLSSLFVINTLKETDVETGWLTDTMYSILPAKHIYEKGKISETKLNNQLKNRNKWRTSSATLGK